MSQINNPIGIDKTRPSEWKFGEIALYFRTLELFIKQVYENLTGVSQAKSFTVLGLPDASSYDPDVNGRAAFVYVSNEDGGPTLAFSDGVNWRRVQDRAIVS